MLYGRRHTKSQYDSSFKTRKALFQKSFQYRYAWFMITAVLGCSLMFLVPAYWFVNQNYRLLTDLAYQVSPTILNHLEREMVWLTSFLIASLVSIAVVTLALAMRMTRTLIDPLVRIEKHMRLLTVGKWAEKDFLVKDDDDLKDFSMTYDYFHRALKANAESELQLLKKITIDPSNREALAAWKSLVTTYEERLGLPSSQTGWTPQVISNDASKSEVGSLRRVS